MGLDTWDEKARRLLVGVYVVGLGVSITLAEVALFLLAARTLWRWLTGRGVLRWELAWPIGAFVVVTFVAAALSARPAESLVGARSVLLLLTLWVVIDALPSVAIAARALCLLLAVSGVVALLSIVQFAACGEPWFVSAGVRAASWWPALGRFFVKCHRAHGFYSIYMTLGGVLNLVLLATLPACVLPRDRPPWAPMAWLATLGAFALTYVRGAWLGCAAGAMTLVAFAGRRRLPLAAGLAAAIVLLVLVPSVRDRARSIVDPSDPTSSERVLMWRSGLAMARDHLLVGVGPSEVKRVYPRYAAAEVTNKTRGHLHSTPLQILVERGVAGLAAWIWLFAAFVMSALRAQRGLDGVGQSLVTGGLAAVVGFLVAGLFEHNFGDTEVLLVALLAMAVVFVAAREGRMA